MTCKLMIERGYREEIILHFDTLVEAGEFINAFERHVEHNKDIVWQYTIIPVMEEGKENAED